MIQVGRVELEPTTDGFMRAPDNDYTNLYQQLRPRPGTRSEARPNFPTPPDDQWASDADAVDGIVLQLWTAGLNSAAWPRDDVHTTGTRAPGDERGQS
jgi:hypothetical protein